ncbi:MAG TPA: oxygenase MpaB family protein [Vicinamibacterales bacterium]|nr:oxygenase MpaB family protein [Vicinamibacterales bacterium]
MPSVTAFERHRVATRERLHRANVTRPGPGSISWKVNREIIVVAGWGRAILLQLAHPLVGAGVHEHSSFRGSLRASLFRLRSTVGAMVSLTFGNDEEAIAAAAGINTIHDRVFGRLHHDAGRFAAGERYSAHDPELLRWVHATLLDSIPRVYELLVGPLTADERDRYCAESAVLEPLLDIPAGLLARNRAELDAYMRDMLGGDRIAVTAGSRELARAALFPPRWWLLWPGLRPVQLLTIGLLPDAVRKAYGFEWTARDARALSRWTTALRWLGRITPSFLRQWPSSRSAYVKKAGATAGPSQLPSTIAVTDRSSRPS